MAIVSHDASVLAKLAAISAAMNATPPRLPLVCEVLEIAFPAPTGSVYYASAPWDTLNGYNGIFRTGQLDSTGQEITYTWGNGLANALGLGAGQLEVRLMNSSDAAHFIPIPRATSIGDDSISFSVRDDDFNLVEGKVDPCVVTKLFRTYGGDRVVRIWRYFPQYDLLLLHYSGYLDAPLNGGSPVITLQASTGMRTKASNLPGVLLGEPHCQFPTFSGTLTTLEDVRRNGCPYDAHLGGSSGTPGFTTCPQLSESDCRSRFNDGLPLPFLGTNLVFDTHVVGQSKGAGISASVLGNETLNATSLGWFMGDRFTVHNSAADAITPETNTRNPGQAALRVLKRWCAGPIGGISDEYVMNTPVAWNNKNTRLGTVRQSPTGYSSSVPPYSGVAHQYLVIIGGPWTNLRASDVTVRATFTGGYPVKRFTGSDPVTYTIGSSSNRAACAYTLLTDAVYGKGDAESEYVPADWVTAGDECDANAQFTDFTGKTRTVKKGTFNYFIEGRSAKEMEKDMFLWSPMSLPFFYQGKKRIVILGKEPDLNAVPVLRSYRDGAELPNILNVGNNQQPVYVTWSPIPPANLVYTLRINFADASINYKTRPHTIRDVNYQLGFGRNIGEFKLRKGERSYAAFGVTTEDEVRYHGERILMLGEFDGCGDAGPGLLNALPVQFTTRYSDVQALGLHEYKVIKIVDERLQAVYPGVDYFRIKRLTEGADLRVVVDAIPYVDSFYNRESVIVTPPVDPVLVNTGGGLPVEWIVNPTGSGGDYGVSGFSFKIGFEPYGG